MTKKGTMLLFILLINFNAFTQPKRGSREIIDDVIIYQDNIVTTRFYYVSYGLKLVVDKEDKPHFKFIQMRYAGARITKDNDLFRFNSLLSFRVANVIPSMGAINKIILKLRSKGVNIQDLQPIPISNLDAELAYATSEEVTDSVSKILKNGFFENTGNNPTNKNWKERDFTLRLNNEDAQLFKESLESNNLTISLDYAFYSKFVDGDFNQITTTGTTDFREKFKRGNNTVQDSLSENIISVGSLSIDINTVKWPGLIKQIDINERVPAEYPALDVYCYDFNNAIRDDLYAKRIEIKAIGVNGKNVVFKNTFKSTQPDIYAKKINFIYAVKLSEPYEYKVTEIYNNGTSKGADWVTQKEWHGILDITSQN